MPAMRSLSARVMALSIPLSLVGCGPPWTVLVAAEPSPMAGQTKFAILPVAMPNLQVGDGSEAEHIADMDAEQRASFEQDKRTINEEYTRNVIEAAREAGITVVPATGPNLAPFEIRPEVTFLEPGYYVGVSSGPSQVNMVVRITRPDGGILDEVLMSHSTAGSLTNPSSTNRLTDDAEALGDVTVEYLQTRIFAE